MKILWAKIDFLHPTNRGGQIRTLEMLRRIHSRHDVHYVAYDDPATPEGRTRASEYASHVHAVDRPVPARGSPQFFGQLGKNLFSPLPLAVGRYRSRAMQAKIAGLMAREKFDATVADFLSIAPNFADLSECVLFQHNVESDIWRRHTEHASGPRKIYFASQARRMAAYEKTACRAVKRVIAVSPQDADAFRLKFGAVAVDQVPTGVDIDYFRRPASAPPTTDLVFVGAMDWRPNGDGARWFMNSVFPRILDARPGTTLTFAGRNPSPEILAFASNGAVRVTGTVPDVRPYLWGASVAIVPLRIGGGTRLKIYEAMAAGVPLVSTSIGAEGLAVRDGENIKLADTPDRFAAAILQHLNAPADRERMSGNALDLVSKNFSWESVARRFEDILEASRQP
jgi:sugar transferase (PEP-CTERM/EpsH1 system associated)